MREICRRASLLATTLAAVGCGDDTAVRSITAPDPVPGTLAVSFVTPFADDGAVSFGLTGAGIRNVRAAEGLELFAQPTDRGFRVAVLGTELKGELLYFDVPDTRVAGAYRVTLIEVADHSNHLRRDSGGHDLSVAAVR